jgi:hypothetical protein
MITNYLFTGKGFSGARGKNQSNHPPLRGIKFPAFLILCHKIELLSPVSEGWLFEEISPSPPR